MRVTAGGYSGLAGSKVIVVGAGVNQKPGESRLELLKRNEEVFREVIPRILEYASDALLLIITNPVDVMTHLATRFAEEYGIARTRVLGSGSTLDTARFRSLLGSHFGVDPQHVHGYVLGEHGDSEGPDMVARVHWSVSGRRILSTSLWSGKQHPGNDRSEGQKSGLQDH